MNAAHHDAANGDPTRVVQVPLGDRSYDVIVGHGVAADLDTIIPERAKRAVVVTQPGVPRLAEPTIDHEVVEIGVGEAAKNLSTIETLTRSFARFGLTRGDVVIGIGGGMVTDVAGFAAATYHRGTAVIHVATSLLAMVDAAIGGKTGVNLPEGKNLVGAFWQPSGVICDLDALDSLPERELRCGYGEMAKYHFLTGDDLLAMPLAERVARSVEIKAEIVAADEREGGRRALLNYGHTLAHALETASEHRLAHGEAVAIGLVYASILANELGRVPETRIDEHRDVVSGLYGLDDRLPDWLDDELIIELMTRDKKALDGLTFVLDSDDGVEVVSDVDAGAAAAALTRHRELT